LRHGQRFPPTRKLSMSLDASSQFPTIKSAPDTRTTATGGTEVFRFDSQHRPALFLVSIASTLPLEFQRAS